MSALEGGGAQRDMVLLCNALAAKGVRIAILALRCDGALRSLLDPAIRLVEVQGRHLRYAIPGAPRIRAAAPPIVVSSEAGLNLCTLIAARSLPWHARPKVILREVGSPSVALYRDPCRQNRIAYRLLRLLFDLPLIKPVLLNVPPGITSLPISTESSDGLRANSGSFSRSWDCTTRRSTASDVSTCTWLSTCSSGAAASFRCRPRASRSDRSGSG